MGPEPDVRVRTHPDQTPHLRHGNQIARAFSRSLGLLSDITFMLLPQHNFAIMGTGTS